MIIGNSWDDVLDQGRLQTAISWSEKRRETHAVYPQSNDVLNAFVKTPFEKVKVVILGQDPYPGCGKDGVPFAHGLSFSSQSSEIPSSLRNILKELYYSTGQYRSNPNLTDWAENGVLLLNTVLTVDAGDSNSHQGKVWERITYGAIKAICSRKTPVVFMLWGKDARAAQGWITEGPNIKILTSAHPSPLSAYRGFFGCNHFQLANIFLYEQGEDPICWGDK